MNEWIGYLCYLSKYSCKNKDVWSPTVEYTYCDSVCRNGKCYKATFPNVNDDPSLSPPSTNWEQNGVCSYDIDKCFDAKPYVPGTTYPANSYVYYECCCYIILKATAEQPISDLIDYTGKPWQKIYCY